MGKTKNSNSTTKKVAPIKVEKIVDEPSSSKKEVVAIIIGVLIVAALVVGSVIYFKGDNEPLTKNNDKKDNVVNVDDDVIDYLEELESEKDKEEKNNYVQKVNNTVKKECKSCNVIILETYEPKVAENSNAEAVKFNEKNNVEIVETYYYTDDEDTYIIEVKGTLKTTAEDMYLFYLTNEIESVKDFVKENKVTEEELANKKLQELKEDLDIISNVGLITVKSDDTKTVTHTFTIRIEEKDQVDWSKGVTVNGITYNESVLKENKNIDYTFQDEDGINIVVGVNKEDLGTDSQNEEIKIDVKYTTKENEVKDNTYILDLENVEIEYEKETDSAEDPENPNATLGDDAITENMMDSYAKILEDDIEDVLEDFTEALEEVRNENSSQENND